MRAVSKTVIAALLTELSLVGALAQLPNCPLRPQPGTAVTNPLNLFSQNRVLSLDMTLNNGVDSYGYMHYCFNYQNGSDTVEAPTLRLNPGDQLILSLTNGIVNSGSANSDDAMAMTGMEHDSGRSPSDPCEPKMMTSTS